MLLFNDLLFGTEVFPLLSHLFLEDVAHSELSQLLLEHQLVVLGAHVVFDLFLTPLELHHDLSVTGLDRLAIVTLTCSKKLKGIFAILLGLVERLLFFLVVITHPQSTLASLLLSLLYRFFLGQLLLRSEHRQLVTQ